MEASVPHIRAYLSNLEGSAEDGGLLLTQRATHADPSKPVLSPNAVKSPFCVSVLYPIEVRVQSEGQQPKSVSAEYRCCIILRVVMVNLVKVCSLQSMVQGCEPLCVLHQVSHVFILFMGELQQRLSFPFNCRQTTGKGRQEVKYPGVAH